MLLCNVLLFTRDMNQSLKVPDDTQRTAIKTVLSVPNISAGSKKHISFKSTPALSVINPPHEGIEG